MSPVDIDRVSRLEQTVADHGRDIARLQGDTSNNTQMIRALMPLVAALSELTAKQDALKESVSDLKREWRADVEHFDAAIAEIVKGQKQERHDADSYRRGMRLIVVAAILSPIGTLAVVLIEKL